MTKSPNGILPFPTPTGTTFLVTDDPRSSPFPHLRKKGVVGGREKDSTCWQLLKLANSWKPFYVSTLLHSSALLFLERSISLGEPGFHKVLHTLLEILEPVPCDTTHPPEYPKTSVNAFGTNLNKFERFIQ